MLRCPSAPPPPQAATALRWWRLLVAAAILVPPIPLGFTETSSGVSVALPLSVAFLFWRALRSGGVLPNLLTPVGRTAIVVPLYLVIHGLFFLALRGLTLVFVLEAQWAIYFVAFLLCAYDVARAPDAVPAAIRFFLWTDLLASLAGLATTVTGPLLDYGTAFDGRFGLSFYRATGTMQSANGLAGVLAFAAMVAWHAPRDWVPAPRWRLGRALVVLVLAAGLVATQSKSGVGALAAGLVATTVARYIRRPTVRSLARVMMWSAGLAALLVFFHVVIQEVEFDLAGRTTFTADVWNRYASSSPLTLLFGFGFRQTAFVNRDTLGWVTAHNSYVSILAEIGAAGAALLALVWLRTLWWATKGRAWWVVAAQSAMLAHFFTEGFVYGYPYVLLSTMLFAMSSPQARLGLVRERRRQRSPCSEDAIRGWA